MTRLRAYLGIASFLLVGGILLSAGHVSAQEASSTDQTVQTAPTDTASSTSNMSGADVSGQIDQDESKVHDLDSLISQYEDKIKQGQGQQTTLESTVADIDNRIAQDQFSIQRDQVDLDALNLQTRVLNGQLDAEKAKLVDEQAQAASLIQDLHRSDSVSAFEVLLTQQSLSAFFDQLEAKKHLEDGLSDAMLQVATEQTQLDQTQQAAASERAGIEQETRTLAADQIALQTQRSSEVSLMSETQNQQDEFARMLYEVQAQQQSAAEDAVSLQSQLKGSLAESDASLARGDVLMNWPVDASQGLLATFHDPNFAFKDLYDSPGIDIKAAVGTPVKASAGGYVAWTKTGKLYGNYLMIVHPGNVATVYGDLTQFLVKPDTYVQRGDVIGLSGGMPGADGSGLSTGPHVHFEVRQDGIPVDPTNYLPSNDPSDAKN